jgi:rhodanese-related sulfurtransferase
MRRMIGFGTKTVTAERLAERLEQGKPVLLDVREPSEFAEGHIPGARNVPMASLDAESARLDPHAETLVICQRGHRSAKAVKRLARLGFTEVHSVKGGMLAWRGKVVR